MDRASADTDDLDAFADHGATLNRHLTDVYETLARQRNHLLAAGFGQVVTDSEITTLDNTLIFMTDLDRFVADISTALKTGIDLDAGVFTAPQVRLDSQLDRTDNQRLDELQAALETQGLSEDDAARIRDEIDARHGRNPRFEIDGATVSEPGDLAKAIIAGIETRAAELIDANQVTSSTLHTQPRLSIDRLAADLYFAGPSNRAADPLIPPDLLLDELGAMLGDDQYAALRDELDELDRRARLASRSLVADAPGTIFDGELGDFDAEAQELYNSNKIGLAFGGGGGTDGYRLDEPEIAYQLQLIAEGDPGRAVGMKWLLDSMMTPDERAELDRILATGGSFSERIDLATSHPTDGAIGAAKGAWNDNFGWLVDGWADAQVAITHGLHGMATNQVPHSPDVSGALPQVPTSWEENEEIIELEFTMDNLAQQGGSDLAFAIEIASAAYGGGKGGLTLIRIGRRFFLRSGDDILTEVSPALARQLERGALGPNDGRGTAAEVLEGGNGRAIAGHGELRIGAGTVEVPGGTVVITPQPGTRIHDVSGRVLENLDLERYIGAKPTRQRSMIRHQLNELGIPDRDIRERVMEELSPENLAIYEPGDPLPNYTISQPDRRTAIFRNSTSVSEPTPISEILQSDCGLTTLATCTEHVYRPH